MWHLFNYSAIKSDFFGHECSKIRNFVCAVSNTVFGFIVREKYRKFVTAGISVYVSEMQCVQFLSTKPENISVLDICSYICSKFVR